MKFKQETGAIVLQGGHAVAYFDGTPGHVDFDQEVVKKVHQANPGIIWKFVHVHPDGMKELSGEDKKFLRTWTPFFYPFPVRLSIITKIPSKMIKEYVYMSQLQSKKGWKESDKKFREIEIFKETENFLSVDENDYQNVLLERSYN